MATISTHNGSQAHRDHNLRGHSTDNQDHIKKDGVHEVWIDEAPREAYNRIFGEALERYNAKQTREERKINNYYNHIQQDEKKHPVYEMIIGVYGDVPEDASKQIMREFVDGWQQRNPNLELIGAYYHADEEGQPHVHLDYIPVASGYSKGLEVQNGLIKALGQQGIIKQGKATAQILWEKQENQALESICNEYGIQVEHPQINQGTQHLHTEAYKLQGDINTLEAQQSALNQRLEALNGALIEQQDLRERMENKNVFGKSLGTVTLPTEEYQAVYRLAKETDDLKASQRKLIVDTMEQNKREKALNVKESELKNLEAELQDRIDNAPKHKEQAQRYYNAFKERDNVVVSYEKQVISLENELEKVKAHNSTLKAEKADMARSMTSQEHLIKEQERELGFFRSAFGRVKEWVLDKFRFLREAEEVLQDPECKTSTSNRYSAQHGAEHYGPYAVEFRDGINYGWEGHRGYASRDGFLREAYLPTVKQIGAEIGTTNFANQDLLREAAQVQEQEIEHSMGMSR